MPKSSLLEKTRSKMRKRAISQSSERKWTKTQPSIVKIRITDWMRGFFKRPENKNNNLIEQMVDGFSTGIAKGRSIVASLIVSAC